MKSFVYYIIPCVTSLDAPSGEVDMNDLFTFRAIS